MTKPLAVAEASGIENVCVLVAEAMVKSVPVVAVAKVCVAPVCVLSVVTPPPAAGVCHVAAVPLVAVSTCPVVGAVAAETSTSVVADLSNLAVMVFVAPVAVLFVSVSVVAFPTSVSVAVGRVIVPVLVIAENTGGDEKVLTPANVWAAVVTTPRAVADALGTFSVRAPVGLTGPVIATSVPVVPTAREVTAEKLRGNQRAAVDDDVSKTSSDPPGPTPRTSTAGPSVDRT